MRRFFALSLLVLVLAGCGSEDGSDGEEPGSDQPPAANTTETGDGDKDYGY
jgi:hypothetical protein